MAYPQLEKLPTELILQIFEEISSPLDIHAFASASPIAFEHYASHRHHILRPAMRELETWLQTPRMLHDAMLACRLRLIPHDILHLDPLQIEPRVRSILESDFTYPPLGQSNLGILCELFRLRNEANEVTMAYASRAWSVLESEAAYSDERFGVLGPPFPHVPLVLSESEVHRFEQGYIQFEINRHCLHYDKKFLLATNRTYDMKWCFETCLMALDIIKGYEVLKWEMRAFQSIFRFLLDKYRVLVQRVRMRIDIERAKQLASEVSLRETKGSPTVQDRIELREEWQDMDTNHTLAFNKRAHHQELRYIAYLCSHGFSLLHKLQRMVATDRDDFILTTFRRMCSRELATGVAERREMEDFGFSLEELCDTVRRCHDPWLSGCYFWDGCRLDDLYWRVEAIL
ncbi:hypothetical protein FSARC_6129 [Fusarium sarcochroum]|uniref:F-box domain-containing protein n=1 Tax=Fusarium sarcochroum TaxID=1208366 RepID=A0A8H4X9F0_9HYPO|nr:hypothetical protein FSARC_6129 [Fusarium sarcochroum]